MPDGYDSWFLEVPEGRAFYPLQAMGFGVWGRGYVVDAEAEAAIKRRLRWAPWIAWAGTMLALQLRTFAGSYGSALFIAGFFVACSAHSLVLYLSVRRFPPSSKRLGFRQSLEHSARASSYGTLYAQFVIGGLFALCGTASLATSFGDPALAALAIVVGLGLLTSWALVWRTQVRLGRTRSVVPPRLRQP